MRPLRTGTPTIKEVWGVSDIMNYLKCEEMKAKKLFEDYHAENGGYGKVEKALMLDYIERKQREEREREARYQSDLSNVESIAVLKEQVKTLKEMCKSSSEDAQKARIASYVANAIAIASLIVAVISILLKVA